MFNNGVFEMLKKFFVKSFMLVAGLTVAVTSSNALAAKVPNGVKLAAKQELVRGNGTEIASLDPHKTEGVPESNVIRDVMEGLVNQDENGKIIPGVAESWETKDNKKFIFHLRKNARWSNGDPVTASDFVYSFKRAVDPATASPYSWYIEMTTMVNAADIIAGKKNKETLGVRAINKHTLEVKLEKALPYFVMMMAHTTVKPVNKRVVEKYGKNWTKPQHFVGNGAYVLDNWVVNERIVLKRNKRYWDNKNTVINKVTYLPIENQVTEMNRFLTGEIDISYEIPNEHFKRLKKKYPQYVSVVGNLCSYYYGFNMRKAPFNDIRVRKALSYTIDREIITKYILGQGQKAAYAFTPEIINDFTPPKPAYSKMSRKQRMAEAKKLLNEAGFNRSNPLKFKLLYNTSENHKKIAIAIASMWKKNLGVKVELENQEWKTFLTNRRQGNFDVTRAGWCGDYNEPSTFLSLLQSNNSSNDSKYISAKYDSLMERALDSTNSNKRRKLYEQAELLLSNDMPVAPIYQYVRSRLINPRVGGIAKNNAEDKLYTKDMYIISGK